MDHPHRMAGTYKGRGVQDLGKVGDKARAEGFVKTDIRNKYIPVCDI